MRTRKQLLFLALPVFITIVFFSYITTLLLSSDSSPLTKIFAVLSLSLFFGSLSGFIAHIYVKNKSQPEGYEEFWQKVFAHISTINKQIESQEKPQQMVSIHKQITIFFTICFVVLLAVTLKVIWK